MITVIGLGFVGLTTALGFSEKGYNVYGYEIDERKVTAFKKGKVPFYEPHLENRLQHHLNERFEIVENLESAIANSKYIFLCVGTPSKGVGSVDLSYIYKALESVITKIKKPSYKILVIKSTVPPGTTMEKIKPCIEKFNYEVGKDIGLTTNPEFLREGYSWDDFMHPDRIVIGCDDDKSGNGIESLYEVFDAPIFQVSWNTAEFIKYLSNTLLATLISFANEQSIVAKAIGHIDIKTAFDILHFDKRWFGHPAAMSSYVYPGCGFGGYCLPKDTKALIDQSTNSGYFPELLQKAIQVNELMKNFIVNDVSDKVDLNDKVGILGLSFKPNSNDVRDTPAKAIIEGLLEKGYKDIVAYDPMAMEEFKDAFRLPICYTPNLKSFLLQVNHVIILTAWEEFIKNKALIKEKNVFDYRYIFSKE